MISGLALSVNASIIYDLANLRGQKSLFTKAYDIIKVQDAWEQIQNSDVLVSTTTIGIIDSGVDVQHPEFAGEFLNSILLGAVNFGNTPTSVRRDNHPGGHGTQVAGIIGANNLSGLGIVLPIDSPQMSGLLTGVPGLNYSLEMRRFGEGFFISRLPLFDFLVKVRSIHKSGGRIINFSQSWVKSSALTDEQKEFVDGQVGSATFIKNSLAMQLIATAYSDVLFIVSAGNENIDASNETPANIERDNVITAAATDLEDGRAIFSNLGASNFGNDVDIAAPGKNIYAPKPEN